MSGAYGPECDELLWKQEARHTDELIGAYFIGCAISSAAWISVLVCVLLSGVWFWIALASAICVWVAVLTISFKVLNSE